MIQKTERFEMRLDPILSDRIDSWREQRSDLSTRAESIRQLIELGLASTSSEKIQVSQAERLNLWMLSELLLLQKSYADRESMKLIQAAILGGHLWALKWHFTGILHGHTDSEDALKFVLNTMSMWRVIEMAYGSFDATTKKTILAKTKLSENSFRFDGFDGNSEGEYRSIAKFLVDEMNRFDEFKGRTMNSHSTRIQSYERMLKIYETLTNRIGRELSAEEVIQIIVSR